MKKEKAKGMSRLRVFVVCLFDLWLVLGFYCYRSRCRSNGSSLNTGLHVRCSAKSSFPRQQLLHFPFHFHFHIKAIQRTTRTNRPHEALMFLSVQLSLPPLPVIKPTSRVNQSGCEVSNKLIKDFVLFLKLGFSSKP